MVIRGQVREAARSTQRMFNQAIGRSTGLLADRVEHYTLVAADICRVLRDRGEPQAADILESLADRTRGITAYLRSADGEVLLRDVQDTMRDRTWLLAGLGLVGGLALARTIRTTYA